MKTPPISRPFLFPDIHNDKAPALLSDCQLPIFDCAVAKTSVQQKPRYCMMGFAIINRKSGLIPNQKGLHTENAVSPMRSFLSPVRVYKVLVFGPVKYDTPS